MIAMPSTSLRLVALAFAFAPLLPAFALEITHGPILGGPGSRKMKIWARTDEAGRFEVARFEGVALGRWQNVTALGDTVWVHATGETTAKDKRLDKKGKLWGFRVRITAEGWMPPEAEAQTLDTPLPIGWQLLELLCEHRPTELLTNHTYLVLTK